LTKEDQQGALYVPEDSINIMWHFTTLDKKLGYGDGRPIIAGEKLTVPGPIVLCKSGLHASKRLLDALKYAPGAYLWEVELSGEVIHGNDKSVATERTALCGFDASEVLRKFSRMVALQAVEKHWDPDVHVIEGAETRRDP
jgi:hypothetical protein